MIKIATHNSGTGEFSRRWWHKIVVPFARCQKKTVIQQFNAGARYFDFRIRKKGDSWHFAHGLWESKVNPFSILRELNAICDIDGEQVYVSFTYEGYLPDAYYRAEMVKMIDVFCAQHYHIKPVYIQVRKPCWETLRLWQGEVLHYCFKPINFNRGNWRWLLPIPWLWWKLEETVPDCESNEWQFVDFL